MNLAKSITYNSIISLASRVVSSIIAVITLGFSTRYLTSGEFGSYNIIWAYILIFSVFADLGLYTILTREISKDGADEKKIIGNIITLKTVALAIFFVISIIVLLFLPYSKEIKTGSFIIIWALFFLSLSQVLTGIFQKYLKIIWVSLSEIGSRILQLLLVILVIKFDLKFYFFLGTLAAASALQFFIMYFAAKKLTHFKWEWDLNYWKYILKISLPLGASAIIIFIYFKFSILLLSFFKSEAEVGLYGLAYKFLESITFFPAMIMGLILPIMSNYFLISKEKFRIIFQKTFNVLVLFGVPLLLGGVYFSDKIILLLGGAKYLPASIALKFLIIACFFIFFGTLLSNAIAAMHKQAILVKIYSVAAIFNIIVNLALIPKYSYNGVALTALFTELLATAFMLVIVVKELEYMPSLSLFWKSFVSASIMLIILFFFKELNIFIISGLGAVVYFLLVFVFKGINKTEILALFEK